MLATLLFLVAVAPFAYSLGIYVPLYFDPGENCGSWLSVASAISTHQNTRFYLVLSLNNSNGPTSSNPLYNQCVPSLRPSTNPNTIVMGYVNASSPQVQQQIDSYAGWNNASRPTGIVFGSANSTSVTNHQSDISYAKGKGFVFVMMDPGRPPNPDFYTIADLVITYKQDYDLFSLPALQISPSAPASKQVAMMTLAPQTSSYSAVISALASAGLAAVYITDGANAFRIPAQWSSFVDTVATTGTNIPSSSPSPSLGTSNTQDKTTPVGAIVGGVFGGIFAAALFVLLLLWLRKRRAVDPSDPSNIHPFNSFQAQSSVCSIDQFTPPPSSSAANTRFSSSTNSMPPTKGRYTLLPLRSPLATSTTYDSADREPPPYSVTISESAGTRTLRSSCPD